MPAEPTPRSIYALWSALQSLYQEKQELAAQVQGIEATLDSRMPAVPPALVVRETDGLFVLLGGAVPETFDAADIERIREIDPERLPRGLATRRHQIIATYDRYAAMRAREASKLGLDALLIRAEALDRRITDLQRQLIEPRTLF